MGCFVFREAMRAIKTSRDFEGLERTKNIEIRPSCVSPTKGVSGTQGCKGLNEQRKSIVAERTASHFHINITARGLPYFLLINAGLIESPSCLSSRTSLLEGMVNLALHLSGLASELGLTPMDRRVSQF